MFPSDTHVARMTLRRVELTDLDDSGEHQLGTGIGYDDERFSRIHRVQAFGFSGVPPAGAHGIVGMVNGRLDQAVLLGIEDPGSRPRGLGRGESVLYNQHGDVIFLYQRRIKIKTETVELEATTFKIKAKVEITGDMEQTGNFTEVGVHLDSNGLHG